MITATGFAVIDDNKINTRTVSPHERAAIVNWLMVTKRIMVKNTWPDDMIFTVWARERGTARVLPVTIVCVQDGSE